LPVVRGCVIIPREAAVNAVAVLLAALFFAVLILAMLEARQYASGRSLITRRRFVIRMLGAGLMLAEVAAIFLGLFVLNLRSPRGHPWSWAAWWAICLIGGFVLMFLALADAKELEARHGERERQLWRDYARSLVPRKERDSDAENEGAEKGNEHG
jgi:fructose-1,6-bisphosphatase/inositol monophosphatase family enzyme